MLGDIPPHYVEIPRSIVMWFGRQGVALSVYLPCWQMYNRCFTLSRKLTKNHNSRIPCPDMDLYIYIYFIHSQGYSIYILKPSIFNIDKTPEPHQCAQCAMGLTLGDFRHAFYNNERGM